jgi:Spy/CpxP family protein refolding chaperone
MKNISRIIAATAATLSLALAGAVWAHPGFGMGPGMGWGPGMGPGMGGPGMGGGMGWGPGMGRGPGMGPGMGSGFDMAAGAAAHLAQLKIQLKITPAQEAPFRAYETVVTQQAGAMQAVRDKMHSQWQNAQPGITSPDFAAQRQEMIALREASFAAHSAALKDLYAVLTPEQRAIADRTVNFAGAQRGRGRQPNR